MTIFLRTSFIIIQSICVSANTYSQNKNLAAQEDKLAKLYSKMLSFYQKNGDSVDYIGVEPDKRSSAK